MPLLKPWSLPTAGITESCKPKMPSFPTTPGLSYSQAHKVPPNPDASKPHIRCMKAILT